MQELPIEKCLQQLEQAIEEKRNELKQKMFHQTHPLWGLLGGSSLLSLKVVPNLLKKSKDITEENLSKLKQEIEEAPWTFLAKTALIGLGIGVMLGTYYKERRKK